MENRKRLIPSAVGGDVSSRHGIILAKSTPAKKYGVVTAETPTALTAYKEPVFKKRQPDTSRGKPSKTSQ